MTPAALPPLDPLTLAVLASIWIFSATGTGFFLALLARRIHPSLSLRRLWIYSALEGR